MIKRIRRQLVLRRRSAAIQFGRELQVGYGKPPKEHQFQPGQSGNPKAAQRVGKIPPPCCGRFSIASRVRTGSMVRKISVREAMLTRFAESALKGDTKSAGFLLQRYDMAETAKEPPNAATQDEQEIIERILQDTLKKGDGKK